MKLQPASKKQLSRIAAGSSICAVIEIAAFVVLHFCGIGQFNYRIILGTLGGTLIAILNFALMCLMVQNAAGIQDEKRLKLKVQSSYNLRIFIQAAWVAVAFFVVAAFFIPFINVIAAAVPLLFPTAVIYFLQITGRLMPKEETSASTREPVPEEENPEDNLNSFEV